MDSPEFWRWIWLAVAAAGAIGEMAIAGSFFLLPFAAGGAVAAVLAFAGVPVGIEWLVFVAVSVAGVVATRPLARRLDVGTSSEGIGARRWIGQTATVLEAIPDGPQATGLVRLGREQWRAESLEGIGIEAATVVKVVDLAGTRLVVWPLDQIVPRAPEVSRAPQHARPPEQDPDTEPQERPT
ncbi:MAG: NfeD family protein [Actinomycetota bacterium]|nr:NfeD family protein [Actinomycetota bacterium]